MRVESRENRTILPNFIFFFFFEISIFIAIFAKNEHKLPTIGSVVLEDIPIEILVIIIKLLFFFNWNFLVWLALKTVIRQWLLNLTLSTRMLNVDNRTQISNFFKNVHNSDFHCHIRKKKY